MYYIMCMTNEITIGMSADTQSGPKEVYRLASLSKADTPINNYNDRNVRGYHPIGYQMGDGLASLNEADIPINNVGRCAFGL